MGSNPLGTKNYRFLKRNGQTPCIEIFKKKFLCGLLGSLYYNIYLPRVFTFFARMLWILRLHQWNSSLRHLNGNWYCFKYFLMDYDLRYHSLRSTNHQHLLAYLKAYSNLFIFLTHEVYWILCAFSHQIISSQIRHPLTFQRFLRI